MDESMDEMLQRLDTIALAAFEQKLPVVRAEYETMDEDERVRFRDWLKRLTELAGTVEECCNMRVMVHTYIPSHTPEGHTVFDDQSVNLPPNAIYRAVLAWEKGEQFSPGSTFGIF